MNKKIEFAVLIVGALLVIASLFSSVKADSTLMPTWSNGGASSGPNGNCNTAVAYWDGSGCRYLNSQYNQLAINWYNSNPNTPAEYNPYIKYNNFVDSNGVSHVYSNPAYTANYVVDGVQYNNALAVANVPNSEYSQNYYNSQSSNFANLNTNIPSSNPYPSTSSAGYGNSNSFSNSFNTITDSYNTNTYNNIYGYNGIYSNSPYYGISYPYYSVTPNYYNYNAYYVSSSLPSSYFYYWG